MTGFERALRNLELRDTDRIPFVGGFICHEQFLTSAVGISNFWENPEGTAIQAYREIQADILLQFVMPKQVVNETEGVVGRHTNFTKSDPNSRRFSSPEDVAEHISGMTDIDELRGKFDFQKAYDDYVSIVEKMQDKLGYDMLWIPGHVAGSCRFMYYCDFGYDNFFSAVLLYKDLVGKLMRHSAEQGRLKNEAIAGAIVEKNLPPYIYMGEDICDNRGPMISPELLDEIYFPNLRYAIEPLKRNNIKIIWHCDGNIDPILDSLIESGIDGFQGFQEESGVSLYRLSRLKTKSSEKPILWGSISVTTTLPFGTPDDVRKDVIRCVREADDGSGFSLAPSSSVGPEVPVENIFAMCEVELRERRR